MPENTITQGSGSASNAPPDVTPGASPHRYQEAFQRALPASQALAADALIPVNIDVPSAIASTVGKLPTILSFREQAKALPEFDVSAFDELETHVLATGQAHLKYMAASAPPEAIVELNNRALELRNILYADAVALVNRNLISGDRIGEFKANIGYKNLAFDLMALAGYLRDNWDKISARTAVQPSELDEAESIGAQLVEAVGGREQAPSAIAEVTTQRLRNFTLFVNAYDQVRRAISYLRWNEGDLETIAPSLYAGRNTGRKKSDASPAGNPPAPPPNAAPGGAPPNAVSAPAQAGHPPNAFVAAAHSPDAPNAPAHAADASLAAVLPGASPFATS